ncbi:MAG: hypothetical protein R3C14_28280 [Caldilineaceae bacterium]
MQNTKTSEVKHKILAHILLWLLALPLLTQAFTACAIKPITPVATPAAQAPAADSTTSLTPAIEVRWQSADTCQMATIQADDALLQGPCDGGQSAVNFSSDTPAAAEDFRHLTSTFASFTAETAVGAVQFTGSGQEQATPAQQRMIAEWSRWVSDAAVAGRTSAAAQLALAWHREGGIAGFCDDLAVYTYGVAVATSCRGQAPTDKGRHWLTAEQLAQIYSWVDELGNAEIVQKDPAVADAMSQTLAFRGNGAHQPSDAQEQAMVDFANRLYAEFD